MEDMADVVEQRKVKWKKKPYEQQFGVYIFCVTTISCKIVKKINVMATTTTTKKKKEKEKKNTQKNILPDEWRLLFEEYQQRKTKSS